MAVTAILPRLCLPIEEGFPNPVPQLRLRLACVCEMEDGP